jgi:hypothetical protein
MSKDSAAPEADAGTPTDTVPPTDVSTSTDAATPVEVPAATPEGNSITYFLYCQWCIFA